MAEVHKEASEGISIWLSKGEAGNLGSLLYVVEESGWDGCLYTGNHQPLWAQMVDADVQVSAGPGGFDPVPSNSVALVDRPDPMVARVESMTSSVLEALPPNATVQTAVGEHNIVLSITVPREG